MTTALCPACGSTRPHLCDVSPPPETPDVAAAFDAVAAIEYSLRAVTVRERQYETVSRAAWSIALAIDVQNARAQADADASQAHERLAHATAELTRALEDVQRWASEAAYAIDTEGGAT